MPKVYVPQIPSRFDKTSGIWVPQVNINAAKRYGDIIEILPPEASRLHVAPLITVIREAMKSYSKDDFIVALGDPTIIAITACMAFMHAGALLRLLKWDRQTGDYILVEAKL